MTGAVAAITNIAPNFVAAPGLVRRQYFGYYSDATSIDGATPVSTTVATNVVQAQYFNSGSISDLWTGYYRAPTSGNISVTFNLDFVSDASVAGLVWVGPAAKSGYSTGNAVISGFGSATVSMLVGQYYAIRAQFAFNGQGGFFDDPAASVTLYINGTPALSGTIYRNSLTGSGI